MKRAVLLALIIAVFFSSTNVLAGSLYSVAISDELHSQTEEAMKDDVVLVLETFNITSGFEKEYESTFDELWTIIGTGEKDTVVTISIFLDDGKEIDSESAPADCHEFTIGSSGMFTYDVSLVLGKNIVVVSAVKNDLKAQKMMTINRKKKEIKQELEQSVSLPGKKTTVVPKLTDNE